MLGINIPTPRVSMYATSNSPIIGSKICDSMSISVPPVTSFIISQNSLIVNQAVLETFLFRITLFW